MNLHCVCFEHVFCFSDNGVGVLLLRIEYSVLCEVQLFSLRLFENCYGSLIAAMSVVTTSVTVSKVADFYFSLCSFIESV